MNTERISQRLNVETSKKSVNTDTYLKINLDGEQRLLPSGQINDVVNSGDRFNIERQKSKFYRILGTINPTISNPLFNINNISNADLYTWAGFNYRNSNDEYRFPTSIFQNVVVNYLKEKDGWFGYFEPDVTKAGFCDFYDMEPKRERFSFLPDTNPFNSFQNKIPVKNWELTVTYPHSIDSGHTMVNNGLLIVDLQSAVVSTRNMTAIGVSCRHNLNIGDIVRISGTTGYDGDHVIIRTGLDNGDFKENYFVIDKPQVGGIGGNSRMKRLFGGVESIYYFRKFKKIKTRNNPIIKQDDYEIYKLGFSENVYSDTISQFIFNEDINIDGLIDNLGRPLSELYLTFIKTDSNNLFGNISSGLETPMIANLNTSEYNTYLLDVPVINKIHNGGTSPFQSHTPLESDVTILDNEFYGDLVEYNSNEIRETVLADVYHRFNTVNRENSNYSLLYNLNDNTPPTTQSIVLGPRQEGYVYKPHHLITIREFSTYVEQGDQFTVNIPDYATKINDGRYLWRDLLDIGFTESGVSILDYPFLNGCHYMYDNYCFTVKRQDPFSFWNLYYTNYPADPIGERITDKFDFNSAEDVC